MRKDWSYKRGDIYLANLEPHLGSEQGGTRPVLVLQNNVGNYFSTTLIVALLTGKISKKKNLPTHYHLENIKALADGSTVQLEQITTIDKQRISYYLGKAEKEQMRDIDDVIQKSLGIYIPEEMEAP
jgi:mRNA interferase MazF